MNQNYPAMLRAAQLELLKGRVPQAIQALSKLVKIRPNDGFAWKLLSIGKLIQGEDCLSEFETAAKLLPQDPEILCNWGIALQDSGRGSEACEKFEHALKINPNLVEAWNNLGTEQLKKGEWKSAVKSFEQAIKLNPEMPEAHNNLAAALHSLGREEESLREIELALKLRPKYATALMLRGELEFKAERHVKSVETFNDVIVLEPDNLSALIGKARGLIAYGETEKSLAMLEKILKEHQDTLRHSGAEILQNFVFMLHYYDKDLPDIVKRMPKLIGERFEGRVSPRTSWGISSDRPLKIAMVSGDIGDHPVSYFLKSTLISLRENHSTDVQITLIETIERPDTKFREEMLALFHEHILLEGKDASEIDDLLAEKSFHIMIDLSGYTMGSGLSLFSKKIAPVQATWLGYFDTTGFSRMDYILLDKFSVPVDFRENFTEKPYIFPDIRYCYTPYDPLIDCRSQHDDASGLIIFGCFNNALKINDNVIKVWAEILELVPDSKLYFKYSQYNYPVAVERMMSRFAKRGISADRLIFEGSSDRVSYFEKYRIVDICLDPFPYTGGTTTCDALYMGVPVLTLQGTSVIGKQGACILYNIGRADLIAKSESEYIQKAVDLAHSVPRLRDDRMNLRRQFLESPVCDSNKFSAEFVKAMKFMWSEFSTKSYRSAAI